MLIQMVQSGEPLITGTDVTKRAAMLLIESGDAVEVTVVELVSDVKFPDLGKSYSAGEVLEVTPETERYFRQILSPRNCGRTFYQDLLD